MAIRRCPAALREDAMQEAWLAVTEGRKPDSAVRAFVRRELRQHLRFMDIANIDPTSVKAFL